MNYPPHTSHAQCRSTIPSGMSSSCPGNAFKTRREQVTFEAVRKELAELAGRHGVPRFGCRMVSRKYAFEVPDIPVEADYLKMVYEFTCTQIFSFFLDPALPTDLQGKTFSNVFGAKSSVHWSCSC